MNRLNSKKRLKRKIDFNDPMTLLTSAVCQHCGNIKVLDKRCVQCEAVRIRERKLIAEKKRLGVEKKHDPVIDEYLKVFGTEMKLTRELRLRRQAVCSYIIMQELRGCFQKSGENYVMPGYNQERINRIFHALDVINKGWGKFMRPKYANWNKGEFNPLVLGELGTTWQ